MLSQEEISQQKELLTTHRRNLSHLLVQAAQYGGEQLAPLAVVNGISEARAQIQRIKEILHRNNASVDEHPDDISTEQSIDRTNPININEELYHYIDIEVINSFIPQNDNKSVEQRIHLIIDYLRNKGNLYNVNTSYDAGMEHDGYILFESDFITPNFDDVLNKSKQLDKMKIMTAFFGKDFPSPKLYVHFESYFNSKTITMETSLAKYKMGLQHLMMMWPLSGKNRRKVRLRVFGFIKQTGEHEYYLKPFAISQA